MACRFEKYVPEYITISVPVFAGCTPIINVPIKLFQSISCLKGTEQAALKQFERLYEIEARSCQKPNYSEITEKLDQISEHLGVDDPNNPSNPNFITISVPVVQANLDGTVTEEVVSLSVHRLEADQVSALFRQVADVKKLANSTDRFSERSHNILGGNRWFENAPESRSPSRNLNYWNNLRTRGRVTKNMESSEALGEGFDEIYTMNEALIGYLFGKLGLEQFPAEVPPSLLGYTDKDKPIKLGDLASYLDWFVKQFDAIAGQFPIEIEIEDADPATPGKQFKRIELPNISEALAETYALLMTASTNSDLSINFLMRLSSEVIAAKNAALITQDYAKGNASFLGYRGNVVGREIKYAFDPTKLSRMDELLKESTGYIQGWEEDDKNTILSYLQKLMFAAGIIKGAFFRNKDQFADLEKAIDRLTKGDGTDDNEDWKKFITLINDQGSDFNWGTGINKKANNPIPDISNARYEAPEPKKKQPEEKGEEEK